MCSDWDLVLVQFLKTQHSFHWNSKSELDPLTVQFGVHMHDCSKMGQDYKLRLDHTWIQSGSGHFQVLSRQDPFIVAYLKRLSLRPKLSWNVSNLADQRVDGSLKARTLLIIYLFILPFFFPPVKWEIVILNSRRLPVLLSYSPTNQLSMKFAITWLNIKWLYWKTSNISSSNDKDNEIFCKNLRLLKIVSTLKFTK